MTILAIDTSTNYLSIALLRDGRIIARYHRRSDMRHSTILMPGIENLLKRAHVNIDAVDCFAISIGPGSFTGLRIGVAAVKGLAYATRKPVITVPTLDLIAMNAVKDVGLICPVVDARKGKVYAAIYDSDGKALKSRSGYLLIPCEELAKRLRVSAESIVPPKNNGFIYTSRGVREERWQPRAEVAALIAAKKYDKRDFVSPEKLEPFYIYSKECDIIGR